MNVGVLLQASEMEIIWVMRAGILGVGILAMIMGITIKTIYGLWYLCADLVYVILFPQLTAVVYIEASNTYGSLAAYVVGMFFRIAGGESIIGLKPLIQYYGYVEESNTQRFPYKTFTMLLVFATTVSVSYLAKYLFEQGHIRKEWDIFQRIVNIPEEVVTLKPEPFDRAPTPSPTAEMAILKQTLQPAGNGTINPALKFSKDDLLTVNGSYRSSEVSPLSTSSDSEHETERTDGAGRPPKYDDVRITESSPLKQRK